MEEKNFIDQELKEQVNQCKEIDPCPDLASNFVEQSCQDKASENKENMVGDDQFDVYLNQLINQGVNDFLGEFMNLVRNSKKQLEGLMAKDRLENPDKYDLIDQKASETSGDQEESVVQNQAEDCSEELEATSQENFSEAKKYFNSDNLKKFTENKFKNYIFANGLKTAIATELEQIEKSDDSISKKALETTCFRLSDTVDLYCDFESKTQQTIEIMVDFLNKRAEHIARLKLDSEKMQQQTYSEAVEIYAKYGLDIAQEVFNDFGGTLKAILGLLVDLRMGKSNLSFDQTNKRALEEYKELNRMIKATDKKFSVSGSQLTFKLEESVNNLSQLRLVTTPATKEANL